jgi:hypothetical protein
MPNHQTNRLRAKICIKSKKLNIPENSNLPICFIDGIKLIKRWAD